MEMVTDPALLAELQGGFEMGVPSGAPSYSQPEEEDDSSVLGTAWEKMKLQAEGFIAANVENPDLSNYARNRYVSQYNDWKSEHEKLGGVGQFASDLTAAAPAIAAFVSTPVTGMAGLATGSALSGLQATGDALMGQYEEGQNFDFGSAAQAGGATAATDALLGGAGSKLGAMAARKFAAPGATGMSALASKAAPAVVDIGVADSASAAASQVYQNLASGRQWDQGTGMAALVGAGAGGAVRGASKGFNGLSESLGVPFNKGGEDAITKATTINRNSGMEPNPEFANSFVDAENAAAGVKQRIDEMDIDDPNLGSAITELNTLSNAKSVDAAMAELGTIIPDLHLNAKGYDINFKDFEGKERNLGRDVLGMSQETMDNAATNTSKVSKSMMQTQAGARKEGITQEAFKQKLHDTYNKKFQEGRGNFGDNVFDLGERIEVAKRSGADNVELQRLNDLHDDLKAYNSLVEKSMKAPSKAEDVHQRIQHIASRIRENAIRTGEAQNLKSFTGNKGDFDPARDFLVFKGLHDSALAQDPSYVYGTTDPLSAPASTKDFNPFNIVAKPVGKVLGFPTRQYRRTKARLDLKAAQSLGEQLKVQRPAAQAEDALAAGDAAGAARASADALQEAGITVPKTETAPVQPATPVTPEPMPEMAPEAPVTPVEPIVAQPSVDAKTRAAPAPKAIEEALAPAPKAKAKAKSRTTPKKKKSAEVKEEGPTPEAVEAAKADLASALQAAIQGGAKRGEPIQAKSRTAPKEKEVVAEPEPTVEAPEKTPAEPKGRKAPERKADQEEVVEVVTEPKVEEAKPKPEAKAAKSPKKKEEPVAEEPAKEAPSEAPREPLGRKEPTRTQKEEEAVESVTEPVVEPTPEPEAPKPKPFAKLVREPLEAVVAKPIRPGVEKSNELIQARRKAERDLRDIHSLEQKYKDHTPEDIARVIHETGGMEKFREAAAANDLNINQQMKARLGDLEGLRKREAALKTKEMKELLVKKTEKAAPKIDEAAVAKKAQREFEGEMEARGIHEADVAAVNTAIEGGMSYKNARVLAQRLNAERKANLKEEVKTHAETLKEANAILSNEGKKAQVDEYLSGMQIEGDKDITKMINDVFKHRKDEVKPKEMQSLLNKIDRHLESQLDEYTSLMRAGGKADPRYPEWNDIANALRSSQSTLKSNRAQVDRVTSKARDTASEAATEHAQLVKEYDKLFDQANTRDANANKVVKQKDELVRDLEEKGFTTEEAEAFSAEAFYKRETTPMNEREMQKTINKFVDQKAKAMEVDVDAKVKEVKDKVAEADDATLIEMADTVADDISYSHKMEANTDEIAMMKAIAEEMGKRGNKTAQRYKSVAEAMLEGVENRAKYPENPELWMSANTLQDIQKSFGSGDSSYAGRLGVALKLSLTGNKEGVKGFGTLDRQVINSRAKKMNESEEGKFLTGMNDLIVK